MLEVSLKGSTEDLMVKQLPIAVTSELNSKDVKKLEALDSKENFKCKQPLLMLFLITEESSFDLPEIGSVLASAQMFCRSEKQEGQRYAN